MVKKPKKGTKKKQTHEFKPTTVLLIRHGENEWTTSNKLAGRTPGVHLNEYGRQQAEALGKRLAEIELAAIYASPLERTVETAQAIAGHQPVDIQTHDGLLEVDYGQWTGKKIKKLAKDPRWPVIQFYPSGAGFPDGETMYGMQTRFVQEVNRLVTKHPGQTIAVVGHADLIKAAVAHYLELVQRI
jgi:probable phosphomutase (TIGR03848 family)